MHRAPRSRVDYLLALGPLVAAAYLVAGQTPIGCGGGGSGETGGQGGGLDAGDGTVAATCADN